MAKVVSSWRGVGGLPPRPYVCGFCGTYMETQSGYRGNGTGEHEPVIYVCIHCGEATYFRSNGEQVPVATASDAKPILGIAKRVAGLLKEARLALTARASTACVMCCRKILMNTASDKGASSEELDDFKSCVKFLNDGFTPRDGKERVRTIRNWGNEANHEIPDFDIPRAEEILSITTGMLRYIYEYPLTEKAKLELVKRAQKSEDSGNPPQ